MSDDPDLQELADRAAAVLGPHIHTSITLRHAGVNVRAASSDAGAARCDQAEALADDGPCIEAMAELQAQVLADLAAEPRWPTWCSAAAAEGYVSVLAMPAVVSPDVVLALNLYSVRPDPWDAALVAAADSYAQLAARVVALRLEMAAHGDAGAFELGRSPGDEGLVEHAVAAIVRANGCSPEVAREVLRAATRTVAATEPGAGTPEGDALDADAPVTRRVAATVLGALAGRDDEGSGAHPPGD